MDETLSEKEQIEEIRTWWKENGTYVIAGLVLGVGSIVGFNQWKSSKLTSQLAASALYESLADDVAENRLESAETIAAEIYANYAETVYAEEARLAMARLFMDHGRDQAAADVLQGLLTEGSRPEMQSVGRLRLARILLYQGKSEEVLELLEGQATGAFGIRYNEVIGDAYFALGQYPQAEAAYQAALADPRATQVLDTALVKMKINDLPEYVPEAPGEVADTDHEDQSPDDVAETDPAGDEETDE